MKKYLTILFIFFAGFIFAGNSAACSTATSAPIIKIQEDTAISTGNKLFQFENACILRENCLPSINENNRHSIFPTISFVNNKDLILSKYSPDVLPQNQTRKFREIKFKIHPRAP